MSHVPIIKPTADIAPAHELSRAAPGSSLLWILLGYLVFVVYGSLIPFDFRPLTFDEGWDRFVNIRYLNLNVVSRADWIANILLYIPLAFLGAAWAHRNIPVRRVSALRVIAVLIGCLLVAFGVEFLQVFFKPRTVSINDLIAETLGSAMGVTVWYAARTRFGQGLIAIAGEGARALIAALTFYLVIYVALSLFPFDFLISARELSWKLSTARQHLFFAPASCTEALRCVVKLTAEVIVMMPVGVLVAMRQVRPSIGQAALYGVLLGLFVEGMQFFMASGVSQGLSVATRGIGAALGAKLYAWLRSGAYARLAPAVVRVLILGALPYLLFLMALNGWFGNPWIGAEEAFAKLRPQMFMPFYYHYFSSEAGAMDSLLATIGMYAPLGLGYWLLANKSGAARPTSPIVLFAGVTALILEGGKLFVLGKHPDPTSVLIAMLSAGLAYRAAVWASRRWLTQASASTRTAAPPDPKAEQPRPMTAAAPGQAGSVGTVGQVTAHAPPIGEAAGSPAQAAGLLRWVGAATLLAGVAWGVTHYPVGAAWLAVLLGACAVVLWQRPQWWLIMVPALLPILDFATWTGWFFLDEFDLLLAVTLAVLLVRTQTRGVSVRLPGYIVNLLALFAGAYAVSLILGMLPLPALDDNAFASYHSRYNALRVGKGVLWALLLFPFLRQALAEARALERYLLPGALAGLAAAVALVVYERSIFPGLLNFASEFRITASFSSMHTGGASVDNYLVLSLPLVAACFLVWRGRSAYLLGLTLYALGLYALFVTFSRIDYAAFAAAAVLIFVGLVRTRVPTRQFFAVVLPATAITAVLSVLLFLGPYVHVRFATVEQDAGLRLAHWQEALALRKPQPVNRLFGMGVGSFPREYFWADPGPSRPASFAYATQGGHRFLRLGSGRPLYVLQRIQPAGGGDHQLRLRMRATSEGARLGVVVCEKSLLYSLRCESVTVSYPARNGQWTTHQVGFGLRDIGASGRPVFFSLHNPGRESVVDVDRVSLQAVDGRELIVNGDFSNGAERWFFTSDDHLSWHVKNLWIHILFEQGWIGVVLFGLLVLLTLRGLAKRAWGGDSMSWILLASLAGGMVMGMTDSVVDTPRIALLLFLLLFASLLHGSGEMNTGQKTRVRRRRKTKK